MKHPFMPFTRFLVIAAAGWFAACDAKAAAVNLGSASSFAVLAGSGITFAGSGPTTITGNIGTFPTASITGAENLILAGESYPGGAVAQSAKTDLGTAYQSLAGRPYDATYVDGFDLVGLILTPGVYHDGSSLFLSGTLTLDARNDPDAVWIFQAGSTLITASASKLVLINGAQASHVYWQVGSSATLGTASDFAGTVLALDSITLDTGATVAGQLLALDGAVTMDNNTVAVPECSTLQLLAAGIAALAVMKWRTSSARCRIRPSAR